MSTGHHKKTCYPLFIKYLLKCLFSTFYKYPIKALTYGSLNLFGPGTYKISDLLQLNK